MTGFNIDISMGAYVDAGGARHRSEKRWPIADISGDQGPLPPHQDDLPAITYWYGQPPPAQVTSLPHQQYIAKILLLEDEINIAGAVISFLESQNFSVAWVTSGLEAIARLNLYQYDMAIFDWVVEGTDSRCACARYRAEGGMIPILMLSGKVGLEEKLSGFNAGADDYLIKPFIAEELLARVKALLRRPKEVVAEVLDVGDLTLDLSSCSLTKGKEEIFLMRQELVVLTFLMRHRNCVFSPKELLERLWPDDTDSTEMAVRKCLTRLRNKIDSGDESGYLVTIKGVGYKLSVPKNKYIT